MSKMAIQYTRKDEMKINVWCDLFNLSVAMATENIKYRHEGKNIIIEHLSIKLTIYDVINLPLRKVHDKVRIILDYKFNEFIKTIKQNKPFILSI